MQYTRTLGGFHTKIMPRDPMCKSETLHHMQDPLQWNANFHEHVNLLQHKWGNKHEIKKQQKAKKPTEGVWFY